ncbi:sulfotransferase 1 family member D1-like isoform X2 [Drosophila rhopaloa]|uniref:Sulfotransferase 1 family member D1-like isoform X2 n=1 Tax=Drosophila rhopaloa TaxID=1041015 RepID=A0A6P4F3L9_DRORH|nr:sulfotransferase 1 family member D1-like isoform X2 [Drosophila rhopaloa]
MYASRTIESVATVPMVQVECRGPNGSGPDWVPLKQDWNKRWCTLPANYIEDFAGRIDAFETRESDVFVVTFMKSGTTWMQELAWLLLNDLDFEGAKSSYPFHRSPFLEYSLINPVNGMDSVAMCNQIQGNTRLIKSHLPAQLLPRQIWKEGRKIIYVARNPKDVLVSSYHQMKGLAYANGSWDEFVDQMRNEENVFFVTYEDMSRDLENVVKRLSLFLDCKDLSVKEMEKLLKHLSFKNIKQSKFGNPTGFIKTVRKTTEDFEFMRRGIVGSFKDELSLQHQDKIDKWTQSILDEYGLIESDIFGDF